MTTLMSTQSHQHNYWSPTHCWITIIVIQQCWQIGRQGEATRTSSLLYWNECRCGEIKYRVIGVEIQKGVEIGVWGRWVELLRPDRQVEMRR